MSQFGKKIEARQANVPKNRNGKSNEKDGWNPKST